MNETSVGFSFQPFESGVKYQCRFSIYVTPPCGFGLSVDADLDFMCLHSIAIPKLVCRSSVYQSLSVIHAPWPMAHAHWPSSLSI